jgi:hypothetical protein
VSDRPIIFSAPMVRALLAGRKTQTRRLIKPAPFIDKMGNFCAADRKGTIWNWGQNFDGTPCLRNFVPKHIKFARGDRLYVREAVRATDDDNWQPCVEYLADGALIQAATADDLSSDAYGRWWDLKAYAAEDVELNGSRNVPSIHMPRWASRLTLMVEAVKVERLNEISEADAVAEGIEPVEHPQGLAWTSYETLPNGDPHPHASVPNASPVTSYRELWESLHGAGSWAENPFVVAVTFSVVRGNIDQLRAEAA